MNDHFVTDIGGTLYLLLAAVALLLLIGCGNVSILLLARGTARQHELAVRSAIGAGRSRILRQLLAEALMLSFTGAVIGVALANSLVKLIVNWLPEFSFPHEAAISINLPVLFFSVSLALLDGHRLRHFARSAIRAPGCSHSNASEHAQDYRRSSRTPDAQHADCGPDCPDPSTAGRGGRCDARLVRMMLVDLGYNPHNIMSVGIPVHDNTYTTWEARRTYFNQLLQKVSAMPEVVSAGLSTNATPPNNGWEQRFEISGKPAAEQEKARINFISPAYSRCFEFRCCKAESGMKARRCTAPSSRSSIRPWLANIFRTATPSGAKSVYPN